MQVWQNCCLGLLVGSVTGYYIMQSVTVISYTHILSGQVLNFLTPMVIMYNLRGIISSMKKTHLRHLLPMDDEIWLHKLTVATAFVFSVIHTLAHIARMGENKYSQILCI